MVLIEINENNHNIYHIDNYWYESVCMQGELQQIGYDIKKN